MIPVLAIQRNYATKGSGLQLEMCSGAPCGTFSFARSAGEVNPLFMTHCPCGSDSEFEQCCGPLIGGAAASTPEALMRSRYTAFVRGDFDHVENTNAPEARDGFDRSGTESDNSTRQWTALEILDTSGGGPGDDTGLVEFAAYYKLVGQPGVHHERSTFRREAGRWFYVDGVINPKSPPRRTEKVGRNDPCPCGSGKKHKKCCGA